MTDCRPCDEAWVGDNCDGMPGEPRDSVNMGWSCRRSVRGADHDDLCAGTVDGPVVDVATIDECLDHQERLDDNRDADHGDSGQYHPGWYCHHTPINDHVASGCDDTNGWGRFPDDSSTYYDRNYPGASGSDPDSDNGTPGTDDTTGEHRGLDRARHVGVIQPDGAPHHPWAHRHGCLTDRIDGLVLALDTPRA